MSATDIYTIEELKNYILEIILSENKQKNKFTTFKNDKFISMIIENNTIFLNKEVKLEERIYCILNNITEIPKCPECNKEVKFKQFSFGYQLTCSNKCNQNSDKIKQKKIETCIERFGVEHPSQTQEIKNKKIETCLERYGVASYLQTQEFKDKSNETCLEKYGVEHPQQLQECKDKSIETCLERFGFPYPTQSQEIKDKTIETCIERYGVVNPSQTQEIKDKKIETCLLHFGVECSFQSKEVKDKIKETCIEKYGVENISQTQECKDKKIENNLEKYGFPYPMQNAEIFEKQQKSCFKRKEYISPDNKIYNVQGYEPFALKYLIEHSHYNSNDVITGIDVPRVNYHFEDKDHVYHPDIHIISANTLVEVKSLWTYNIDLEENIAKKKASMEAGFDHITLIFDKNGVLLESIY